MAVSKSSLTLSQNIGLLKRLPGDTIGVLNFCAKHLARTSLDNRHAVNMAPEDTIGIRASIAEAWQLPLVEAFREADKTAEENALFNRVTFIYFRGTENIPETVSVVGSFGKLHETIELDRISDTPYFYTSLQLPKGQVFTYKFIVDGQLENDPVNPQTHRFLNGEVWSRFFTDECATLITFSNWEHQVLDRLVGHILPFRSESAENFLARHVVNMDRQARDSQYPHLYRVNQSVGVINFIDKLLAKQERHLRTDYTICLQLMNQVLTTRDPINHVSMMRSSIFEVLYDEMGSGSVPDWDYSRYNNPAYFLQIFRRHAYTGAFSHPKHGGNASGSGWAYIQERLKDDQGKTLFNWRQNFERPLGTSKDYNG